MLKKFKINYKNVFFKKPFKNNNNFKNSVISVAVNSNKLSIISSFKSLNQLSLFNFCNNNNNTYNPDKEIHNETNQSNQSNTINISTLLNIATYKEFMKEFDKILNEYAILTEKNNKDLDTENDNHIDNSLFSQFLMVNINIFYIKIWLIKNVVRQNNKFNVNNLMLRLYNDRF